MSYPAKSIANFFLELAKASGETLSPMKLQKLVYYAQGWYAGYTKERLIDEEVEAWQYGPVIPSLYLEFKEFGSGAITRAAFDWKSFKRSEVPAIQDVNIRAFLTNVWDAYGKYTAIALSEFTHAVDGPWDQIRRAKPGIKNADIPFEMLQEHFQSAVEKTKANAAG
jgi:uncharacterized phage-associated protein